jgi:sec-independent protein translocase protein TatA
MLLPSSRMGSGVLSPWHIAIFALVVLLVFGPKRLPEMGRSLGKGIRELKDGITSHHEHLDETERTGSAPSALPPGSPAERDTI